MKGFIHWLIFSILWCLFIAIIYSLMWNTFTKNITKTYYIYEDFNNFLKNLKSFINKILRKYLHKNIYKLICNIIFYIYYYIRNLLINIDEFISIYIGDFNKILNFIFFKREDFEKIVKIILIILLLLIIIYYTI